MGYMASGKTRIGKELAISLGYYFSYLDCSDIHCIVLPNNKL